MNTTDNQYIIEAAHNGLTSRVSTSDFSEALEAHADYFHKSNVGGTVTFRIYHNGLIIDETVTAITTENTN